MLKQSFALKCLSCAFAVPFLLGQSVHARLMDSGIDPANLGTGQWIYFLSQATNRLGGNVSSVTDIPSLMAFYKSRGIDFVVVKSGTGAEVFPAHSLQFTKELVDAAHAAGLKIFGYTRSDGKNVPGEIQLACDNYELGADGFVIDAEAEWESHHLGADGPQLAIELCKGIKERYPTKFLAHSPFPIISKHSSFPYKEFGLYCDAVMPQAYWKSIRVSPARMVEWMNDEWHAWHRSLLGDDKMAIKPIDPIGQGWSPSDDRIVTSKEILQFVNALNSTTNPPEPNGYKGVSYWRTDLHTASIWSGIKRAKIGDKPKSENDQADEQAPENLQENKTAVADKQQPATDTGLILDDTDEAVVLTGAWFDGKSRRCHGVGYRCANTVKGNATAFAIFRPQIPESGRYHIYIRYVSHENRSKQAPWTISCGDGVETVNVDQTKNDSDWVLIASGKFFKSGSEGFISVSNDTGEPGTVVVADAVRLVLQEKINSPGGQ
mgnify:FL=1